MKIITKRVVKWHMWKPGPGDFDCMVCHKNEAKLAIKIDSDLIKFGIIVCQTCFEKGADEIGRILFNGMDNKFLKESGGSK
ncbi:hypothetical protein LCGC14_1811870 [marine sediment metagenome]|uniref:Uncharacterized protein n=1 Tax=marine sediment metagenome TaxID=412755 RepID=A0A0F9GLA9_9ZZZZ